MNILPQYIARCRVYALVRAAHNRTAWPLSFAYFVRSSSRVRRAHASFECFFTVVRIAVYRPIMIQKRCADIIV